MDNILATFNVVCVTTAYGHGQPLWHQEETGEAVVIEKTVGEGFGTVKNKGFNFPLAGLTYPIVKFQGKEFILTMVTDGLDGMAVCLMVQPLTAGASWMKLYTDTPTPTGETSEAVRSNARETIKSRRNRRW